jgi:DNA-binding CsgD family transcriptional regulator
MKQIQYEPSLTNRERELIKYLLKGLTAKEIALILGVSKRTVEMHKYNIYKKCGVNNTPQLFSILMNWITRENVYPFQMQAHANHIYQLEEQITNM